MDVVAAMADQRMTGRIVQLEIFLITGPRLGLIRPQRSSASRRWPDSLWESGRGASHLMDWSDYLRDEAAPEGRVNVHRAERSFRAQFY